MNPTDSRDFRKFVGAFRTRELIVHRTQGVIVNIARDTCGIPTTSSLRGKFMSSFAEIFLDFSLRALAAYRVGKLHNSTRVQSNRVRSFVYSQLYRCQSVSNPPIQS